MVRGARGPQQRPDRIFGFLESVIAWHRLPARNLRPVPDLGGERRRIRRASQHLASRGELSLEIETPAIPAEQPRVGKRNRPTHMRPRGRRGRTMRCRSWQAVARSPRPLARSLPALPAAAPAHRGRSVLSRRETPHRRRLLAGRLAAAGDGFALTPPRLDRAGRHRLIELARFDGSSDGASPTVALAAFRRSILL